jgi:hypothetical protein
MLAVAAPAALAATTITSGPSGPVNSTTASFSFTGSGPFSCTLDGTAASCTSPKAYNNLTETSHAFHVQSAGAGAPDPGDSRSWTVDVTPPDTNFTDSPANGQSGPSASWSFDSTEANSTFQCSLDGGAFASCTSPKTFNSLTQGLHVIQVRARDQAGNNDSSPALGFWTADATPPETTITQAPSGFDSATSTDIVFSSNEANSTFMCSLDGAPATACNSPDHLSGLADGAHSFSVQAIDAVGNVDPTAAKAQWTVDSTPPDTTLTAMPAALTTFDSAQFKFTTAEPNATFECSMDGEQFAACTSPQNPIMLTEGSHTFAVRARDLKGNLDPTPAQFTWTVDRTRPPPPVLSVESVQSLAVTDPGVNPAPSRTAKAVAHPQPQPTNPAVPFGPGASVAVGAPVFSTGPQLKASWASPAGSEPVTYDATKDRFDMALGNADGADTYGPLGQPGTTDTSAVTSTVAGQTYCFNVVAHDHAGNDSWWPGASCTTMPLRSKSLTKSGPWLQKNGSTHYGGGYSEATHGSLTLKRFLAGGGAYGWVPAYGGIPVAHVALVATRCRGCGTVKVTYHLYWDTPTQGTTKTKSVNLSAASDKPSQIIPLFSFPKEDWSEHLEVKIEITSAHKPVRIEGLGVSRF